jgi:hypothetical protein
MPPPNARDNLRAAKRTVRSIPIIDLRLPISTQTRHLPSGGVLACFASSASALAWGVANGK